jgi:hypothetical protein
LHSLATNLVSVGIMNRIHFICIVLLVLIPGIGSALRINEVCSSNSLLIADYYGNYEDWIELKNTSADTLNLNLYCLSDSPSNLRKFRFPAGSIIAPGQIILIWAVNNVTPTILPNGDFWGTNFAVSANGEPVYLSLYAGPVIVDQMPNTAIPQNVSYGRIGAGLEWYYFPQPTPREENTTPGYNTILTDPIATQNSGWYATSVVVDFVSTQTGVEIRYTLDGSIPTESSPLWSAQQTLYDRSVEPNNLSLIPTVLPNLPPPVNELDWWFPPSSNIPKIHTFKARSFAPGALPSNAITKTYMVGIDLPDFPIVSVTLDPDDLFDDDIGIYVAGNGYNGVNWLTANFMQDWERPSVTEWFDVLGNLVYRKQADVEIQGTYTARAGMKSLRFKTPDNPDNYFNYPFFGTDYLSSFRYLVLRNSGNDVHMTLFRDNFVQGLMEEQNLDVSRFAPYIVFLNGEYWGVHTLQERVEEYFVSTRYGIPLSELDVIERDLDDLCGDDLDYRALLDYIEANDEADPAVWQYLETRIDMRNFIEYMAGQIYVGNTDWPGNNIRYWRKRVPFTPDAPYGHDGRWRWLVYDMDFSYGLYQNPYWMHDTLGGALNPELGWRTYLLRNLIQNPGFRNDFINTFADRLNHNWQPSGIISKIDQYEDQFESSMPQHIDRWCLPSTMGFWHGEVNALRTYAVNRPDFLRNSLVNQFALSGTANVTLQIEPENRAVIRMNNTVDLPAGNYTYFQNVPVAMQAIPNPGWEIVSFAGMQTDSLTINPTAEQTIQLVLQETVSSDEEVIPSPQVWAFQVFPNPVKKNTSTLSIRFSGEGFKHAGELKMAVYNVKGQRITSHIIPVSALESGEWSMPLGKQSPGLYIIRMIQNKSLRATRKITIQ